MWNDRECTSSNRKTPRTHSGVRFFESKCFPRVREKRVPGANVLARLRRAQPEGLIGNKPRVERFVRHPGLECLREERTAAGVRGHFGQHRPMTAPTGLRIHNRSYC